MSTLARTMAVALALVAGMSALAADTELKVKEGDKLPEIKLPSTGDKKELDLSSLKGKNVVLFFYPKAMTKGCTVESCGFRDVAEKFAGTDTVVVGISIDPLEKQAQFTTKEKLNFPLLADSEGEIAKKLGVMADNGKVSKRVTFVIDKEGVIRKIYTKVTPATHPAEVLAFIKELK